MAIQRGRVDRARFRNDLELPYELRVDDFALAMQDVYDFFFDVNNTLQEKGLMRLDDMLRPAIMSGVLSDMLTASLAKHSRVLTENRHFNGHPDLVVRGLYPGNAIPAGEEGVEIKTTRKLGGAVDMHGARSQCLCVFVYAVDNTTEPATEREAMRFVEVYIARVTTDGFRRNARGELGTRTATLNRDGLALFRRGRLYQSR